MRTLLGMILMAATYCLALASADPWDIGMGLLLGFLVLHGFRRFIFVRPALPAGELARRLAHLPRLMVVVAVEIVRGTWIVAKTILSRTHPEDRGFVSIPIGARTDEGVIFSGFLNTLSPGSVYIGVDDDANSWVIHAMDTSDAEQIAEEAQQFYDNYQRPVLP
ncbi:MAG: Na+/H+ antiporter subunit E [Thermomicrobiales bacterium]